VTPDSLHVAAATIHFATRDPALAEFFDSWHEFYLLAGTAAVTLVGLLFVALSFNLDVLLHETKVHVLAHARATLLSFTYVLIISLGFLVPFQNLHIISVLIIVSSIVVGSFQLRQPRRPAAWSRCRSSGRWRGAAWCPDRLRARAHRRRRDAVLWSAPDHVQLDRCDLHAARQRARLVVGSAGRGGEAQGRAGGGEDRVLAPRRP
jgi:hypothetical protein